MKSTPRGASSSRKRKSRATRAGLHFPVGRIHRFLKDGKYSERVAERAPVYLAAALQYMAAKVLELSGNEAKNEGKKKIVSQHIRLAIKSDAELSNLLGDVTIPGSGNKTYLHEDLLPKSTGEKNKHIGFGSK